MTATAAPEIGGLSFGGTWRRYQTLALDAFEADRRHGRRRTHIVAPPGSGKTLLGVEIVRRLGARALVLVPNTAVQEQWLRAAARFGAPAGLAAADPSAPIACLTYQALCQLDDPAVALGNLAERRWAAERAKATGTAADEVERDAAGWTGAAAERRKRELARITASLKREIARAGHGDLQLGSLLSGGARQRIEALRQGEVRTVVLDECHHLASLWGYIVREAITELGDVHLVGLTATPPDALTAEENELYGSLLGPVDFTVPTPALVRERALAPYQELAWLTRPLDAEAGWLTEHDLRFQELITTLHAEQGEVTSMPAWVIGRMRDRGRGDGEAAAVSWTGFQRRHPALARAGARFLASGGLELPPGVPRGEGYREPPDLDDWLVLLEDYALHCLAADPSQAADERYAGIAAALRSLGFTLTRQGIRRGVSDVDRLLMNSAAKSAALVDVVGCEFDARERWGIGQPYSGAEQETLVILPRRPRRAGQDGPVPERPPSYRLPRRGPLAAAAAVSAVAVVVTALSGDPAVLAGLAVAPAAVGWAGLRLARTQRSLDDALPLDLVAHAICDAYRDLGELTDRAAASLAIEPRASGYLRCYLPAATTEESERFASALDDALSPADFPRYLVSRLVPAPEGSLLRPLGRFLSRKPPFERRWVAVPEDFGRAKQRAEAYARDWRRWLGPAELLFTQRSQAGRDAVADANAQRSDYQTSARRIWV